MLNSCRIITDLRELAADAEHPVGLLGGSFDPPHLGHVLLATAALSLGEVSRIWAAPVGRHPLGKTAHASLAHRTTMTALAMAPLTHVSILTSEEPQDTPSYTLDTVRKLLTVYPTLRLRLLIGSDLSTQLTDWHQSARLVKLAPPLILPRATATLTPSTQTEGSDWACLLYTSPSPRDLSTSRMPSSA